MAHYPGLIWRRQRPAQNLLSMESPNATKQQDPVQKETFDKTPNPGTGGKSDPAGGGEEKSAAAEYAKQYSQEHNPQPTVAIRFRLPQQHFKEDMTWLT